MTAANNVSKSVVMFASVAPADALGVVLLISEAMKAVSVAAVTAFVNSFANNCCEPATLSSSLVTMTIAEAFFGSSN